MHDTTKQIRISETPRELRAELESLGIRVGDDEPEQGGAVFDHFRLLYPVGKGGMGVVLRGRDDALDIDVAVKVISSHYANNDSFVARLISEARAIARLDHPNIVRVLRVGQFLGQHYIAMEFINGRDVNHRIRSQGPIPPLQAARIAAAAASALIYAHRKGVVHRDVKPHNILVSQDGEKIKLVDFGIARDEAQSARPSSEDVRLGSPSFMAPELYQGANADETSDVYSLGVTLYNMLAGDISEELRMRLFDPEQLSSARPKLAGVLSGDDTRFFSEVIEGMCEREPADRPLMIEVLSQLEEYLAQNQIAETRFHERPKAKPSTAKRTTEYLGNSNIREPLAPFVGRQHELRQLAETLGVSESGTLKQDHEPPRVLTLLGSGGAGKTRLAQRFAALYQSAFPGGTWFADLSQCQNAEDIVHTVAGIFRIRLQNPESAASVVGNALAGRARTAQGRLLLVLDNFEQCVDAAESVLGEWLSKSDQITVLVTSRMLLGLSGEEEFNVGSLSLPPRDEELPFADEGTKTQARQLENFDAVRLFMSRARASTPELSLDPSQVPAIVEICRRLDGNPLALELAASRVKVLPPAKLLERLDNRFEILRSGRRSNESRQSTLRSTIDWSWDLLADYERSALAQLSTFRSGFMLEAAEAVLDLSEFDDAPSIVDVVQSLRDKSLINRRDAESTDAGIRFGFFESIRDYAFERKAEQLDDDQLNALHLRFGRYFVGYAQRLGEEIFGPSGPTALNALELEIANVLEAQELLLEMESPYLAAQAICAIADVLNVRGPHAKRIPYLERSLSAIDVKEPDIGKIGVPSTDELYQAFAPLPEWIDTELDPLRVCAQVIELLVNLTAAYLDGGNTLSAERAAQRAVNLARGLGSVLSGPEESAEWERSSRLLARALDTFSAVEERRANNEQALEAIQEAEEIERELASPVALANIISQRGNIMIRMERADEALRAYQEAEQICRQCGNQIGLTINVSNRGWVALLLGRYDEALRCFSEGEELSRILHFRNGLGWNIGCRGNVHQNRGEFDQALECLEEAELIFREMGNLVSVANNVGNRGGVLAELGRYDEALACYAEAEGIARRAGDEENLSFWVGSRASVLARQGKKTAALKAYAEAEARSDAINSRSRLAQALVGRADIYLRMNRVEEALLLLEEAMRIFHELGVKGSREYLKTLAHLAEANWRIAQERANVNFQDRETGKMIGSDMFSRRRLARKFAKEGRQLAEKLEARDFPETSELRRLLAIIDEISEQIRHSGEAEGD